jgi:hypothetical protein
MVVVPYTMDSLIPQNKFEGEVPVMGLCNLNLRSGYRKVEKSVRESDRASEFGAVSSTCKKYFNIRVEVLNNNCTHPR